MAIDIPVSANFNDGEIKSQISQINSQIKALGSAVAQANKQKFEPISLKSKEDLKSFVQQTQQLLKVQTELRNRMKETGQGGKMPLAADWAKMYPNVQQRNQKLQEVLGFYGNDFEGGSKRRGGGRPGAGGVDHRPPASADTRPRGGSFWGGVAARGLGGAGPLGSTAGGAINAGMSGGGMGGAMRFGLAGLLAFGASKAIGSVTSKIGAAEDNEIAYDTLKRTLGDVNVAFKQLKSVVKIGSEASGVTYAEGARLSTMYAKAGNLSGADFRGMGGEVGTGIGLSRSYGLDPSQGVGMLGMMRGLGVTRSETDTRRFALLIGETIGKSGAFAKADEMMEAISGYAAMQARMSLTNSVSGYAGQISGLMNVGGVGLDVGGASSLLAKVDAALRGGGGAGEASQFFSAGIGARHGLDPFELQTWREGGSSATISEMLGEGSRAEGFGFSPKEGDETWLTASTTELRRRYGSNPGALAHATARHFGGISMNQAMAMQQIQTPQMGTVEGILKQAGFDLKDLDASAISSIGQVASGSAEQRMAIAKDLYGRTGKNAISDENRIILDDAMSSGKADIQTNELIRLLAHYGQENSEGKDIRDTKVGIDNLNTSLAERLIPLTQSMRDGILYMAGKDKNLGPVAMGKELARLSITEDYEAKKERAWRDGMAEAGVTGYDHDSWINRTTNRRKFLRNDGMDKVRENVAALDEQMQKELADLESGVKPISAAGATSPDSWIGTGTDSGQIPAYRAGAGLDPAYGLGSGAGSPGGNSSLFRALIQQESGGNHRGKNGGLLRSSAGALGITQIMPDTGRQPGFGVKPLQNDSEQEYLRFGSEYLEALIKYYKGDKRKALAAYNGGAGSVDKAVKSHGEDWLSSMSSETQNYVPSIMGKMNAYDAQMPASAQQAAQQGGNISVEPLQVNVNVSGHGTASAPQQLQTKLGPAPAHR